jgi:hypothetical protein
MLLTIVPYPYYYDKENRPAGIHKWIYAEAIAEWAGTTVSPTLQVTDLRKKLSNIKKKNFLAYHHFNPSLFETLKKWRSVKKYSDKYRHQGETFFRQDCFSQPRKR